MSSVPSLSNLQTGSFSSSSLSLNTSLDSEVQSSGTRRRSSGTPKTPTFDSPMKPNDNENPLRYFVEKLESLGNHQKILLQTSTAYSMKLESLENVNKTMNLKMEQMMETINESFKVSIFFFFFFENK